MTRRKPIIYVVSFLFFLGALGCFSGSGCLQGVAPDRAVLERQIRKASPEADEDTVRAQVKDALRLAESGDVPGSGLPALAWLQSLIVQSVFLLAMGALLRWSQWARVSVALTLLYSLVLVVVGILLLIQGVARLLLMLGLFLAVPFGTLAYIALYGFFPVSSSAMLLGGGFALDLIGGLVLILGNPRILAAKKVMGAFFTVSLMTLVLAVLHGWVPGLLVSIADVIGALVFAILMIVWAVFLLVTSLLGLKNFLPR